MAGVYEDHAALLEALQRRFTPNGIVLSLEDWQRRRLGDEPKLTVDDMRSIVDQAINVLQDLYVHMEVKRARRGVDPVRQLRVLKERLDLAAALQPLDSQTFHKRMLEIFKSLGDMHTAYRLPAPYISAIAFLPFLLNAYFDDGTRRYIVTRTLWDDDSARYEPFQKGVEVISWNGVPMEEAVKRSAEFEEGASVPNDLAMGLQFMTVRWLGASFEPDSPWVVVDYRGDDGVPRERKFLWCVLFQENGARLLVANQATKAIFGSFHPKGERQRAVHMAHQVVHSWRRELFVATKSDVTTESAELMELAQSLRRDFAGYIGRQELKDFTSRSSLLKPRGDEIPSLLPLYFEARLHPGSDLIGRGSTSNDNLTEAERNAISARSFGYIGIRAFALENPERALFKYEFRRLLNLMPQDGLILDVRDNPGGSTQNAEESLQFFTPTEISPLPFRFIATPVTKKLAAGQLAYRKYEPSLDSALATGAAFSAGLPITSVNRASALGQQYFGPVILVTNGMTYSAADIFAAGFEDNGIGPILGVDETTGAGGANAWFYQEYISKVLKTEPLPRGVNLQIATRQCARVGPQNFGVTIEEIGVPTKQTMRYNLSKTDIIGARPWALLLRAAKELSKMERFDLETRLADPSRREITVLSKGLTRLDFYVNGRPTVVDVESPDDGRTPFILPPFDGTELEIFGYARQNSHDKLVARYVQVFLGKAAESRAGSAAS